MSTGDLFDPSIIPIPDNDQAPIAPKGAYAVPPRESQPDTSPQTANIPFPELGLKSTHAVARHGGTLGQAWIKDSDNNYEGSWQDVVSASGITSIEVVTELPDPADPNTLYLITAP